MFIFCQFTMGKAPNDPAPTSVSFVVVEDSPFRDTVMGLIGDFLREYTGGPPVNAIMPERHLGFASAHDHDHDEGNDVLGKR